MKRKLAIIVFSAIFSVPTFANTIADWTFETSQPISSGTFSPETGSGSASGYHANSLTGWGSPVGNGSAQSFSSDHWTVGDYWQFSASTIGFQDISISWDQASSGSGPGVFGLFYSTDGGISFNQYSVNYTVLGYNVSPNPTWVSSTAHSQYSFSYDLDSIPGLNDDATAVFRLVDESATSANGGTVGTTGADRVDNFIVEGTAMPDPVPDSLPFEFSAMTFFGILAFSRRFCRHGAT